jgi:hypothetical protein
MRGPVQRRTTAAVENLQNLVAGIENSMQLLLELENTSLKKTRPAHAGEITSIEHDTSTTCIQY